MNILIVRVSSLGDVVHNMPMVADILRHYPQANIDWVVEESYVSLVRLNQGVRKIIPFALRRWRKSLHSAKTRREIGDFHKSLRSETYDIIFDTQGLLKTSIVMRLARMSKYGKRVGLANSTEGSGYEPVSKIFHTLSVPVEPRTHAVLRSRLVAAAALEYDVTSPADFHLSEPEMTSKSWLPRHPYVVFFHGTARDAKRWKESSWVQLAQFVGQRGLSVLLPWGSESEFQAANRLASKMGNAVVLPKLPIMEAVLLARRAAFAVGVDTGLTHIAAAFNRPTVELYCDSPRWKTEGNWSENIVNLGDTGNPPTVAEVEHALLYLMEKSGLSSSEHLAAKAAAQVNEQAAAIEQAPDNSNSNHNMTQEDGTANS